MVAGAAAGVLQMAKSPLATCAAQGNAEPLFRMVIVSGTPNMLDPAGNRDGSGGFGILGANLFSTLWSPASLSGGPGTRA
ncbi:MAG: hypothetical protein R2853_13200 [Thermomicrobiales bacterium]